MTNTTSIALLGITGRMGRMLLTGIENSTDLKLSGGMDSPDSPWINKDASAFAGPMAAGVVVTDDPVTAIRDAQVAIAFALPQVTQTIADACVRRRCPLILGTTGHTAEQRRAVDAAAQYIPVVMTSNFSLGVNLLFKLAEQTARVLDADYDIEIYEAHHRNKKDAPSGTALSLGEAVAKGRGVSLQDKAVYQRYGDTGVRERGSIGFSVVRGGDIIGDHTVTFAGIGERIELTHRASDRMAFAQGALHAARWVVGKPAGMYSMQDVLGN
ncbi:MAG TPA: 4-hydroxy-tetrahydrodipicolinate reductase [Steroidobacteraceae bacterium]|nr:4-hydroxy-tetrahydrodipicolinate reductase [Steroidobacteraceae bacterium]